MKFAIKSLTLLALSSVMVGCGSSANEDLQSFMETETSKLGGRIEPLPEFPPYVSVVYSAAGLRSPFDLPRNVSLSQDTGRPSNAPDPTRQKEFLERFNFAELAVVGSVVMNNERWALIDDGVGSVHRVRVGMFLGQNHGRISNIQGSDVTVIEIVPDGQGGWIERPRSVTVR